MKWSRLCFREKSMKSCEGNATLSLEIARYGNVEESVFGSVRAVALSADLDKDVKLNSAKQIQFDPGMNLYELNILREGSFRPKFGLNVIIVELFQYLPGATSFM